MHREELQIHRKTIGITQNSLYLSSYGAPVFATVRTMCPRVGCVTKKNGTSPAAKRVVRRTRDATTERPRRGMMFVANRCQKPLPSSSLAVRRTTYPGHPEPLFKLCRWPGNRVTHLLRPPERCYAPRDSFSRSPLPSPYTSRL